MGIKIGDFFLKNQNELDIEFQDITFESTIKKLQSKSKDEELTVSVVRFSDYMKKIFTNKNISFRDQLKLV